jgi:hypothetical protein
LYHQLEHDDSGNLAVDILHVFGRTPSGEPRVYFYRQRVDGEWTAWERIGLDIVTEHLIPVVWNRRLYLFWPVFTQKAEPRSVTVDMGKGELIGGQARKCWDVQLAWSERNQGAWSNKKISDTSSGVMRIYEDELTVPGDAFFRAAIDTQNVLTIAILNRMWFDPDWSEGPYTWGFEIESGHVNPRADILIAPQGELVTGTRFDRMYQAEVGETPLFLPSPTDAIALATTPGYFRLLPHTNGVSIAKHPTFYQDDWRTYFVAPFDKLIPWDPGTPDTVDPGVIFVDPGTWIYYSPPDLVGPVINPSDPPLFEPSYATLEVYV